MLQVRQLLGVERMFLIRTMEGVTKRPPLLRPNRSKCFGPMELILKGQASIAAQEDV
jgi:hypothetical protein